MNPCHSIKNNFFIGSLSILILLISSCASTPEVTTDEKQITGVLSPTDSSGVHLNNDVSRDFFYFTNSSITQQFYSGSPSSLRSVISEIRKNQSNYSAQEKVVLAVSNAFFTYAWTSDRVSIEIPNDLPDNLYISTLKDIASGVYSENRESEDFISLILPSLVLLSAPSNQSFYEEAEVSLQKALNLVPDSVIAQYLYGILLSRKGQYEKFVEVLKKAYTSDSENISLKKAYTQVLWKNKQAEEAFEQGLALLSTDPQNIEYLGLCAETSFALKNYEAAESYVAQILQKEPESSYYLLFRAKILFQMGEYLKVSSLLDAYSRMNSSDKDYLLLRTQLQLVWNKNTTAAIATVQEALKQYPSDYDVILMAAEIASIANQGINGKNSLQLLEGLSTTEKQNTSVLVITIREAVRNREWEKAYDSSVILLQNSDKELSVEQFLTHVEICLSLNKISEGKEYLDPVYITHSANEEVIQWHLRLLKAEGKKSDCLALINSLLQNASGKLKTILYYERSTLQSTDEGILSDLRQSLTANPRNENALYDLYQFYFTRGDYRKAQYYLKQVLAITPQDSFLIQKNVELDKLLAR